MAFGTRICAWLLSLLLLWLMNIYMSRRKFRRERISCLVFKENCGMRREGWKR